MGECNPCKIEVRGSSPLGSTMKKLQKNVSWWLTPTYVEPTERGVYFKPYFGIPFFGPLKQWGIFIVKNNTLVKDKDSEN